MNHDEVIDHYRHKHETDPGFSKGSALYKHIPRIASYVQTFRLRSVLDYGCGKASFWKINSVMLYGIFETFDTPLKVDLYDPAIPEYSTLPDRRYDLVVCTDVLEHVLESEVPDTLYNIIKRSRKLVYLNISTIPATKTFPNGTNLHLTIKPKKWWLAKIKECEERYVRESNAHVCVAVYFDDER